MLTQRKVERAKEGRHHDGDGLYLRVKPSGAKSWLLRFEIDYREHWMGLGSASDFNLREARRRAREQRQLLADHINPIDRRREVRAARAAATAKLITFKEAMTRYFDQHEKGWRNGKHRQQFLSTLNTYARPILNMAASDIDTAAVLRCIEPHWITKCETMMRTRGRIERVLDWCKVRGYRSGDNPAAWKGHLVEVLPKRSQVQKVDHHPALPYAEIANFIAALHQHQGTAAKALEFCILTCARTGEVLGAQNSEIHPDQKVWIVPAGRTKGGREHRVALPQRAIDLLRELPMEAGNDFIFIGSRPGTGLSSQALTQVLRRMGRSGISVHGFRSTFRDWCAEQTNFPRELAEMALAHRVGDKTELAYRRGDGLRKRHALAEAWARFCSESAPAATAVVTPMRSACHA